MKTYKLSFLKYSIRVTPGVPSAVAFADNTEIVLTHEEMRPVREGDQKYLFDLLVKLWEKLLPYADRPAELAPMCTLSNYTIEETDHVPAQVTDHEADNMLIELEEWSELCQDTIVEMQEDQSQLELF